MTDAIERTVELAAPIERVWEAIADYQQFGAWFRVKLEGPFVVAEESRGQISWPGAEHLVWQALILRMDAPDCFIFSWHPYAVDPDVDYSIEEPTIVTFRLAREGAGTRLTVTEEGFDKIPAERREEARRMNDEGWGIQLENVRSFVEG